MLFDLHNDYLTASKNEQIVSDLKCGNLSGVIFAVWASKRKFTEAEYFSLIKNIPGIDHCDTLTAIEDIGSMRIADYDAFLKKACPAYVSLTWNGENELAGGVGSDGRLTGKGKIVLRAIERCGVTLDLAHLNEKSFWDVLNNFGGRIIVSHTGIKEAFADDRNLDARQLLAIKERQGIIGIFAAAKFIGGEKCTRQNYLRHVLSAVSVTGIQSICIGTDFCGASEYPEGFDCYTDINLLFEDMQAMGLNDNEINKIFHINAENFFGFEEKE